jgi:hypothetical protein
MILLLGCYKALKNPLYTFSFSAFFRELFMPKQVFHKDVNYDVLSVTEKKIKASRELFTIFVLDGNKGLTDVEIWKRTQELKMTGYAGLTPDCIVRSNIFRWNDMAISSITRGKICENPVCKKICSWGHEENKPHFCQRHKKEGMTRVVEERLIKLPKEPGQSKGKYVFDEKFAVKVFGSEKPKAIVVDEKEEEEVEHWEKNDEKDVEKKEQEPVRKHWTDITFSSKNDPMQVQEDLDLFNWLDNVPPVPHVDQKSMDFTFHPFVEKNIMQEQDSTYTMFANMKHDEISNMDIDAWLNCQ